MAIKLDTLAEDFDTATPAARKMLENLQSNILKPHGRNFVRHLFLKFTAAPAAVKGWLRQNVVPLVRTADSQFNPPPGQDDGGLVGAFFLSASGYKKLGFSTNGFASDAFRSGMKTQSNSLLGPLVGVENKDPEPKTWEEWSRDEIHALVTVADDDEAKVHAKATELVASVAGIARVLVVQEGNVLRRLQPGGKPDEGEPVEHFGYRDGISQPIFTKAEIDKLRNANPPFDFAKWDPSARLSLVLVDDPLSDQPDAFGSYLVYRKLAQNLRRFDESVAALSSALKVAPELAGALAVGRFKDGTPVVAFDKAGAGEKNDFDFRHDDPEGARCPIHAHIRKVNPRGTTPFTSLASEKRRRIARRGIPYGKPIGPEVAEFPASDPDPDLPRGLLFLCFQANIEEQFEFIQRTWVDNVNFPRGLLFQKDTGDDPLVGQDRNEAQRWPKRWGDPAAGTKAFNFESAIHLRGGEYFFAPSIPFLKAL